MPSLEKIAEQVAGGLDRGEQVVAACKVMPSGVAGEFLFRSASGRGGALGRRMNAAVAERVLGDAPDEEREAAAAVGMPLEAEMLLVLTDRRLQVWGLSKLRSKPTEVLGVVPLEDLAGVERGEGTLVTSTVPKLTLRFRGGEELGLVAARPSTALLDQLAAAISERLPG